MNERAMYTLVSPHIVHSTLCLESWEGWKGGRMTLSLSLFLPTHTHIHFNLMHALFGVSSLSPMAPRLRFPSEKQRLCCKNEEQAQPMRIPGLILSCIICLCCSSAIVQAQTHPSFSLFRRGLSCRRTTRRQPRSKKGGEGYMV